MERAEWTPSRCQVQTTYLIIYENEESTFGWKAIVMRRAFVEPYAKLALNINFFRKVVLVKLRVDEVSQCRRSHQRVGHVLKQEELDLKLLVAGSLGQADSAKH